MPVDVGLLESVARLALFADLARDELEALLDRLDEVSFDEGHWILRRGDEDVGLHVIVDGEVGVVLEEEEIAVLSKGSFFGEISALLHEPTVADIVARTNVRCLFVPDEQVEEFLLASPRVMYRMLQTEARRVRTTDERHI
jgi:CRP/FNR family transcriptional regulator, cyclic AMP receptor protein